LGVDRGRQKVSAGISQHAKENDEQFRNLFVGEDWAKVRLWKFAKNQKKCFPCSGKRKEDARMPCGTVNGKPLTDKEDQEYQQETTPPSQEQARREEHEQEGIRDRAQALALKLAQTYEELTRLLERNPGVKRRITEGAAKEDRVYQKLKQRLKLADMAPRCQWVRQDGTSCRSPQMKQHIYCFAHRQMAEARTLMLMLPPPEDANAIQVGLMRIQKAVIEDTISTKKAGLLLYSMQLALTNVGQTTFGQAKDEEMVRDTVDEMEAFSENRKPLTTKDTKDTEEDKGLPQSQNLFIAKDAEDAKGSKTLPLMNTDDTDFGRQHQNQILKPFTAKHAEDTKENQDLPLINTDDTDKKSLAWMEAHHRGLKSGIRPVEWRPTPDMYRIDTPEGREAYEASFSDENRAATRIARAVRPVIAPEDRAETHAILG
jgi:transposase-like protein